MHFLNWRHPAGPFLPSSAQGLARIPSLILTGPHDESVHVLLTLNRLRDRVPFHKALKPKPNAINALQWPQMLRIEEYWYCESTFHDYLWA